MKEIFLVLSVLIKTRLRKKQGEKRNPLFSTVIVGMLMFGYSVMGGVQMIPIFVQLQKASAFSGFVAAILLIISIVSTLFALPAMMGTLFFSKDGEFYLHLPLKPSSVFMAKMLYIYFSQLYTVVITGLPILIIAGASLSLSVAYYAVMLLGLIITPFMGMMVASIIALPFIGLAPLFKNKNAFSSVVIIFLFAVFMAGYVMFSVNGVSSDLSADALMPMINTVRTFAFPFTSLADASLLLPYTVFGELPYVALAFCVNLLVAIAFFAVITTIMFVMCKAFYNRSVSALTENYKPKSKSYGSMKNGKIFSGLMALEIKTVMRNPSLAFSLIGSGVIFPILAVVFSVSINDGLLGYFTEGVAYALVVGMGASLNTCACTVFSKDGENFYAYKYLPVSKKSVAGAKLLFSWIISSVFIVLSVVLYVCVLQAEWLHLLGILPALVLNLGICAMDMLFDLRRPKLDWTSVSDFAKNSSNVIVPTFISLGITTFLMGVSMISLYHMGEVGYIPMYLTVFASGGVLCAVFLPILFYNCERMINNIE